MTQTISLMLNNVRMRTIFFDIVAMAVITFLPAISHMLSFPLYLIEPMRVLLILSIVHTTKQNTYLIAAVLPILSFILSSHPVVFKMLLVTSEMIINVWLFFYILKRLGDNFYAAVLSILAAKIYYYAVKSLMISGGLIDGGLIATPIYLQAIVALVLSAYIYLMIGRKRSAS